MKQKHSAKTQSKIPTSHKKLAQKTSPCSKYLVMWDFPSEVRGAISTFYRRLNELLRDQGGNAHCRATRSAYVIEGDNARTLAYAIAALAEHFGAGRIGEQDGVAVFSLGDISPSDHFNSITQARQAVETLCVDRRQLIHKRTLRDKTIEYGAKIIEFPGLPEYPVRIHQAKQ
jgi:hypothetical protein